jgi:putative PIN family toxin of toxin-antitoxin system
MPSEAFVPGAVGGKPRVLLDAMVLAAGLTSRREPRSFSRRLIELGVDDQIELIVTERLIDEVRDVLIDPAFTARVAPEVATSLVASIAAVAKELVDDRDVAAPRRCADPDDDYLVDAALATGAMLVSRDDRADFASVPGLLTGRPGTALRQFGFLEDEPPIG